MYQSVKAVLARAAPGGEVAVRGWLRTARHSKGVSFLDVSDGSCFGGVQVVAEPTLGNYESELRHLRTGCAVIARGELVASPAQGQRYEIRARQVEVVGHFSRVNRRMHNKSLTADGAGRDRPSDRR